MALPATIEPFTPSELASFRFHLESHARGETRMREVPVDTVVRLLATLDQANRGVAAKCPVYSDDAGSGSTYCTMCDAEKPYPDSREEMATGEHDADCPWRHAAEAMVALRRERPALKG